MYDLAIDIIQKWLLVEIIWRLLVEPWWAEMVHVFDVMNQSPTCPDPGMANDSGQTKDLDARATTYCILLMIYLQFASIVDLQKYRTNGIDQYRIFCKLKLIGDLITIDLDLDSP